MSPIPATQKGQQRRAEIIAVAGQVLDELGPASVTMRHVATRAGCSLSAMTYYFTSADELLAEAGRLNIAKWASRAERVAEAAESCAAEVAGDEAITLLLRATLPDGQPLLGHYLQLIAAGQSAPVSAAYNTGRGRLNMAVSRVLTVIGVDISAELAIAVVDGAAVSALSEGRDVRQTARSRLVELLGRAPA